VSRLRADAPPAVRLEIENEWAWCGGRRLSLAPRVFAVLRHLVEHSGRLITKEELLATVWRDAVVSDAALASGIRDLRRALGDSSGEPRYVQTVHRRGFRFIGPVAPSTNACLVPPVSSPLVGREAELARLRGHLAKALGGQRQLVFVTGEPGIGKTALVETFLAEVGEGRALRIGRGQCVEHYGAGEAYLPMLDALGRLGRAPEGASLVPMLGQHAPTWLEQLPSLLSDGEVEAVQRRARGATRGRLLRELGEALDALTRETPLVLVLEDLHWSDAATVDCLGMLARRRAAARLLIVGTYRPTDVAAAPAHPLRWVRPELQLYGYCDEISLAFLTAGEVSQYLDRRFPDHHLSAELALVLHRSTDGNPMFLVNTVEYLIGQGQIRELDGHWRLVGRAEDIASRVPETLGQLVEEQLERLTAEEQAVLVAASVAGAEFSAAAVADDVQDVELRCGTLARRGQFLRAVGTAEWPDGTVAGRYAFIHALYQHVLHGRVSPGARAGLHLRTAQRLERAYGERAGEIAGELAAHFACGRDFERAARYRRIAGEHALRQHAYREAADHATRGLELLEALPESRERTERELTLQVTLGAALTATQGYGAQAVASTYARARDLCAQVGETSELLAVLRGIGRFYVIRGELQTAREVGAHLLALAESRGDIASLLMAHNALGVASLYAGEFEAALQHLERGIALYDVSKQHGTPSPTFRLVPPDVTCGMQAAWALWMLGYPDRATARAHEALALARSLGHPFTISYACHLAGGLHQWRRETQVVQALEAEALAHDTEHGFGLLLTAGAIQRGWLLAEHGQGDEGLAQMRAGLARQREMGAVLLVPGYLALMAELHAKLGRPAEGLSAAMEALAVARRSGPHYWESEAQRLLGVLSPEPSDAESHLLRALEIARRQRAKWLELRAAIGLGRLWAAQGHARRARGLVAGVYAWFSEGFGTADLTEARALLDTLGDEAQQAPERNGREQRA
jgi:predicted ATPase